MALTQFNFLSGSVVNNYQTSYLDIFGRIFSPDTSASSGVYLGFSKNRTEWGQCALINIQTKAGSGTQWYNNYIGSNYDTGYYDLNSGISYSDSDLEYREIFIVSTAGTATDHDFSEGYQELQYPTNNNTSLYMSFIGENWCQIENLNPLYWEEINIAANRKFYIIPFDRNTDKALLINKKEKVRIPFNKFDVNLYFKSSTIPATKLNTTTLKCSVSVKDELVIEGLTELDISNAYNDYNPFNNGFTWEVRTTKGILLYTMTFSAPVYQNDNPMASIYYEKDNHRYVLFSIFDSEFGEVLLKATLGPKEYDSIGIWHEALPYETSLESQISDGNPPGLPLTYLKHPLLHNSLFDVSGLVRLRPSNVWFTKELRSQSDIDMFTARSNESILIEETTFEGSTEQHFGTLIESVYSATDTITLENDNTFVVGDIIVVAETEYTIIEVGYEIGNVYILIDKALITNIVKSEYTDSILYSKYTTLISDIKIAKTQNIKTALRYSMYNVLIDKVVPGGTYDELAAYPSPTPDRYRQLFVCYNPSFYFDEVKYLCTDEVYQHDELYSNTYHDYDLGYILYLANKPPLYRKHLTSESFKFILF
jgi:hypothetical protein